MEAFDVTVENEVLRVRERRQPGGGLSYDFLWVNGPAGGTYGFTIGRSTTGTAGDTSDDAARMTREELVAQVQGFVEHVYEPGGLGETWPDHVPARNRF